MQDMDKPSEFNLTEEQKKSNSDVEIFSKNKKPHKKKSTDLSTTVSEQIEILARVESTKSSSVSSNVIKNILKADSTFFILFSI